MRSVSISELKNHLSSYLNDVRAGKEILIYNRNLAIAKIVPIAQSQDIQDFDMELMALAATGKARLPEETLPESFWLLPAPKVPIKNILTRLRADRDEY
jgi:prevent-host-death family protein